jgi:cytoskeletal protein CcmA (bactofilin family)
MANPSPNPNLTPTPYPAPAASERRVSAWIGKAVRVEGKVTSGEDLTIDGDVEGSIEVGDHSLTIGPGAVIKADLVAKTITIAGAVVGNVKATERLELHAAGSVAGDIASPRFLMAEGATVSGKVHAG